MSSHDASAIKTMNLYTDMDRIAKELKEHGHSIEAGDVPLELVQKVTMLSYSGTAGCAAVAVAAGLTAESRVLDLGSGLGGPARGVSDVSGCAVTAVEYQQNLTDLATLLTARCGMTSKVACVNGDGCDPAMLKTLAGLPAPHCPPYDAVVSWLVILHIPFAERPRLFDNLAAALKPGAMLYVEDFYAEEAFADEDRRRLADDVAIPEGRLPTRAEYEGQVAAAGFGELQWEDVTAAWSGFVAGRHDEYVAAKERHVRVHSEETFAHMDHFYSSVRHLFTKSQLKGVRLIAKKM